DRNDCYGAALFDGDDAHGFSFLAAWQAGGGVNRPAAAILAGSPGAEEWMHLFKQQGVQDYDAAAGLIPVIDYGPYFAGAPGALERVAAEVAHACENIGFFYALTHGVPEELIERAFAASRRFHALPLAEKLALKLNENNIG